MVTGVLIGAGQRGAQVYAAYALKYPERFKIVAVSEPDDERRCAVQKAHNIPVGNVFLDWKDLLRKDKIADCALVCTMDREHAAPVKAALSRGYHVLCEKPMSPNAHECIEMGNYAAQFGRTLTVCHVLRYSPFFTRVKEIIQARKIGDIVCIQQLECVGYWHQAHSFVRGNWRNSTLTSPMILQKSCHDIDILLWLSERHCKSVSSYGSLMHFRPENAPTGSPQYCMDGCPEAERCPYNAERIYLETEEWYSEIIRKVVAPAGTREAVSAALKRGPYGRCVYHCDNDVVDHQVVNLELTGGVTCSFTMSAFTGRGSRLLQIMGTHGQLICDMEQSSIEHIDFATNSRRIEYVNTSVDGHSGSDSAFMEGFLRTVDTNGAFSRSSAKDSVESHLVALAAEQSRLRGTTIPMEAFFAENI